MKKVYLIEKQGILWYIMAGYSKIILSLADVDKHEFGPRSYVKGSVLQRWIKSNETFN